MRLAGWQAFASCRRGCADMAFRRSFLRIRSMNNLNNYFPTTASDFTSDEDDDVEIQQVLAQLLLEDDDNDGVALEL